MGIRGLETYLEKYCHSACYQVNIKDLIDKYRHESGEIVIVVDGSSCLRYLYGDLDWVLGGQIKELTEKIKNFVQAFKSLGVRLVFYFDGATIQRKRPVWINRRLQNVKSVYEVFDIVNKQRKSPFIDKRLFLLPAGIGTIARYIFKFVCGCEVRTSVKECDEEIAEFAQVNRCFAILGQDTDYLIYEGSHYYFSVKNLDITTMTTLYYNRSALANALRISVTQLPLFASLCGNDIIQADDLQGFHNREWNATARHSHRRNAPQGRLPFHVIFKNVADYIRRNHFGSNIYNHLPIIARHVFRDEARAAQLEVSLRSYCTQADPQDVEDFESNWSKILQKAKSLHVNGEVTSLYTILLDVPFETCSALEDFRTNHLPAAAVALRPLRERIYGVLLREKPGGPGPVQEWCVVGTNSDDWRANVTPSLPPQELHPGLLSLWGSDAACDMTDTRWRLFAHSVCPGLGPEGLRSLADDGHPHLVVPASILKYLRDAMPREATASSPQHVHDWELEALAVQAVLLTTTDPSQLAIQTPYDVRAIQLATVFMRAVSQMLLLLASCGFPIPMAQAMPWLYFDGKLFHQTYVGLKNKTHVESVCRNQDGKSLMQEFLKVRNIVLGPAYTSLS